MVTRGEQIIKQDNEKEQEKTTKLTPASEEQVPLLAPLSERDARYLIDQITDICSIAQSAFALPDTTTISRSPNYYISEILRAMKDYNIIVD